MPASCAMCPRYDRLCITCRRLDADRSRRRYAAIAREKLCNSCGCPVGKSVRLCDACAPACEVCGARLKRRIRSRDTPIRYCSHACQGLAARVRDENDSRSLRWQRDLAAPGLKPAGRRRLLAKWKRSGRTCAYCPAPPTTVDHIVPLVRGGTNFEGNLAPACRGCNGSKAARLLVEWRRDRGYCPSRCTQVHASGLWSAWPEDVGRAKSRSGPGAHRAAG